MKIGFFGFNNGVLAESEAMAQALQAMADAVKCYEDLGVSRLALLPGRLPDAESAVRFIERTARQFSL